MLPVNCGSHCDYQTFVVNNLRKYYPDPDAISRDTWGIIDRFWNLDLSYTDQMMQSKYCKYDPTPRTPSCMQRSYLLSIDFKVTSVTGWVAQLKINPLYAILSGFEVGDTPGVGTFYDFFSRLWDSDDDTLKISLTVLCLISIQKSFCASLLIRGSLIMRILRLPAMELLLLLQLVSENTVFVIVLQKVFLTAAVTGNSPSQTVISDGILPEAVSIMAMICI